jgi:glycosyltransferase involved in cell wall biosynthesis
VERGVVRNLLFLTPSLDYGGAARQLTLLAAGLPRDRFQVRVCVLGRPAPWDDRLRRAGVQVDVLGRTRPLDLVPYLALRRLVRDFRPAVLHAWGPAALHAVYLSGGPAGARLIGSALLPSARSPHALDRFLLRRLSGVLAFGNAEAARYHRAGVSPMRTIVATPAEEIPDLSNAAALPELPDLPADARVLLGVGPLEPHKGFRDAVWALDILNYLMEDLHLILAGTGSDRAKVAHFARAVGAQRRVHFAGPVADLVPLLQRAEVVWVPSRQGGGVGAALAAMAAGKPVVASSLPALAEVVADGETGYLVPPGDKPALARQTRLLLEDPELARRLGAAGRERVRQLFPVAQLAAAAAALYEAT